MYAISFVLNIDLMRKLNKDRSLHTARLANYDNLTFLVACGSRTMPKSSSFTPPTERLLTVETALVTQLEEESSSKKRNFGL
jgi:hypothetical protein